MPTPPTSGNAALALSFLEHCFKGRMDEALPLLAPDATWWVMGNPEKVKVAGTRDMERIARFLRNVMRGFPDGMDVKFEGVTAEGERVAIEATASARTREGFEYHNNYHFLVRVREGRVREVREYMDTHAAYEIQLASLPPPKI